MKQILVLLGLAFIHFPASAELQNDFEIVRISVIPTVPKAGSPFNLSIAGTWRNSCVPSFNTANIEGATIRITASVSGVICLQALTDYAVALTNSDLGQPSGLDAGVYRVEFLVSEGGGASLYGTNTFSVTDEGGDGYAAGSEISGSWYNPAQSGHGFVLEILEQPEITPDAQRLLAYWFTFDEAGNRDWLFGSGDSTSAAFSIAASTEDGGAFPPNFDAGNLTVVTWGQLDFTFLDCDNALVAWTPLLPGYQPGSMTITRLTSVQDLLCN